MWGSSEAIVVVNLTSKSVERVAELLPIDSSTAQLVDTNHSSSSILDVSGDNILLVTSSPTTPQQLCVHNFRKNKMFNRMGKLLLYSYYYLQFLFYFILFYFISILIQIN